MSVVMLVQIFFPATAWALTSGPSQPEVQQFQPAGTSGMVDLFTGDFNYNIPLFELPGPNGSYPFNLGYRSGITMDQEASWVGLGWNLNPGVITRQMRGLPDEFAGDKVKVEQDMKADETFGISPQANVEIFGGDMAQLGANASYKLYYNSYRGFGYGFGVGPSLSFGEGEGTHVNAGLNLSLDSQEGVGFGANGGLTKQSARKSRSFSTSIGYNSRTGLTDLGLGYSRSMRNSLKIMGFPMQLSKRNGGGSNLSLAHPGYTPEVILPKTSRNLTGTFKVGVGGGAFASASQSGFYSGSWLSKKEEEISAFGYQNLHLATEEDLMDVNREKEGQLHRNTPNLPAPNMTYDIYAAVGQGISGQFRPFRSDVGILHNQQRRSGSAGGNAGGDISALHFGGNVGFNFSQSLSGRWNNDNGILSNAPNVNNELYHFAGKDGRVADYEPWYFRMLGESTSESTDNLAYINGDEAVRIELEKDIVPPRKNFFAVPKLENKDGQSLNLTTYERYHSDKARKPRNTVINPVTQAQLGGNFPALKEYAVKIYENNGTTIKPDPQDLVSYVRNHPGHHTAGMSVDNASGMRYVYALPAYNKKQVEAVFSVDGSNAACGPRIPIDIEGGKPDYKIPDTDQYYNRKEIPEYAHSYLLTSVLGQDYVDADTIPGPSDGDFGFWVKFNYVRVNQAYKWRAPFTDANFDKGRLPMLSDDKGNYMYGEKEVWYLSSAETKTHISEWYLSRRLDGKGAAAELQNTPSTSNGSAIQSGYSYKIDSIGLFSKIERIQDGVLNPNADPISMAHFEYNYELCGNAPNNANYNPLATSAPANSGKLTLKKLWFTQEESTRGTLSPYEFDYAANGAGSAQSNPAYNTHAQDRWGVYQPYTDFCDNAEYPYTSQYRSRAELDAAAGTWSLKGITLPTGGVMSIAYEADDYAYVQDKRAARMFKVKSLEAGTISNQVYNQSYLDNYTDGTRRRIYFETPFPISSKADLDPYFKDLETLYGKFLMQTKKVSHGYEDYVKGYFKIEDYGKDPACTGNCTTAFVQLAPPPENEGKWKKYPPIALAAWHHLRTNLSPLVATPPYTSTPSANGTSAQAAKQRWKSLASIAPTILQIFSGYYRHAFEQNWAQYIDLDHSWIRLNEPDKIKVGGGHRVKQITLDDRWATTTNTKSYSNIVGTVYDYTTVENGQVISSGVASYEPMVGGDENPWRTAKSYPESTPLKTDFLLFYEYPINEQYMPAPVVGYRKVAVKSLATEKVINQELAATVPTTGAAVHEFWTAKDFPVQTSETRINMQPFYLPVPIPFIGQLVWNDVTASQGYSIVLNDMHGKPRRVSNYGQDVTGQINPEPISWVEYDYNFTTKFKGTEKESYVLENEFDVLNFNVDRLDFSGADIEKKKVGEDHEFFVDMRQSSSNFASAGVAVNLDNVGLPFPSAWPQFTNNTSRTRTAVTNKIIHRTGISTGMRAWNEGSLIVTEHKLYDAQTGRPLLSTVTNDFDAPIYSYTTPAFWDYDRMGPAYKNIGLEFGANSVSGGSNGIYTANGINLGGRNAELLIPGDEMTVRYNAGNAVEKAIFVGFDGNGDALFWSDANLVTSGNAEFVTVRSGRHNLLGVDAQSIVALKDPTQGRDTMPCFRDVTDPATVIDSMWVVTDTIRDTVPAACAHQWVDVVNLFLQNGGTAIDFANYPFSRFSDFCFDCRTGLEPSDTWSFVFECSNPCRFRFADAQGDLIPLDSIQALSQLQILNYPGPTPGSNLVYSGMAVSLDMFTRPQATTAYILSTPGSNCALDTRIEVRVIKDYRSTLTVTPNSTVLADTLFMLDSVLSASATTYSDAWVQDFSDVRFEQGDQAYQLGDLQGRHPFASGERGIWRAKGSYVYVTDRRQSTDLNLAKDGTFDGLPMFNFQSTFFASCAKRWRHVSEVTRYSPYSFELENRDVLDVHSAALYGYRGKLPIAVAANAEYREIGFESFEEYDEKTTLGVLELTTGNIDLYTNNSGNAVPVMQMQEVIYGQNTTALLAGALANGTYDTKVEGRTHGSTFDPAVQVADHLPVASISGTAVNFSPNAPYLHQAPTGTYWNGRLGFERPVLSTSGANGLQSFSADKAHTGKLSYKWTGKLEFAQNRLKLQPGEMYALQLWVSRTDENVPTYFDLSNSMSPDDRLHIAVKFYNTSGNLLSTSPIFEPAGRLVEGWQKIEGEFTVPAGTENISFVLNSGDVSESPESAYLDDIRLQPLQSKMSCHVYNTGDYRLHATLDDDNFALRYQYDEAGNIYLIQKETVDGWRTIQESRGFSVEQ